MSSGPLSLRLVAAFLGRRQRDMGKVIKEDGLPTVPLNSGKRPEVRIYFTPLLNWINKRAENEPMTADQLEAELDRCRSALSQQDKINRARHKEKHAIQEASR